MSLKITFSLASGFFVLTVAYTNCSKKTDFNSVLTSSLAEHNTQNNQLVANEDSTPLAVAGKSSGLIVHRPLCFATVNVDYNSYCNVSGRSKLHTQEINTAVKDLDFAGVPSCEIVIDGKSSIFHLNGPLFIGQFVNGGAVRVYYSQYMTEEEYSSAKSPCDLAIQRAAIRQDQKKRQNAELSWGTKIATELDKVIKENSSDIVRVQKNLGQFIPNHFSYQLLFNTVHCVSTNSPGIGTCGTSNIPRWKNPPQHAVDASLNTDYRHYGEKFGLDRDLNDQDYFNLCQQCGH